MLKNLGGSFYEMRMRAGERGGGCNQIMHMIYVTIEIKSMPTKSYLFNLFDTFLCLCF